MPEEETAHVQPLSAIESVKVGVLDEEHEQCAAALQLLAEVRDNSALQGVLDIFQVHFRHEEQLLDEHMYAGLGTEGGFSADASSRKSHYQDHERMLQVLRRELQTRMKCGVSAPISGSFIDQIFRDFEHHANMYDGNYADRMAAALA